MKPIIKNIAHDAKLDLNEEVSYLDGQIVSKTLAQTANYSLTLFAIDQGEEISTHESKGDAFVQVLDGVGRITIAAQDHIVEAGQAIVMPANTPHAVYGEERFKMLLTVLF